jgi:hypothetical protein
MDLKDFLLWEATVLNKRPKSDGPGWEAQCDACPEALILPDADCWEDALDMFRDAGWKSLQVKGFWEHRCPSCLKDLEEKKKTP